MRDGVFAARIPEQLRRAEARHDAPALELREMLLRARRRPCILEGLAAFAREIAVAIFPRHGEVDGAPEQASDSRGQAALHAAVAHDRVDELRGPIEEALHEIVIGGADVAYAPARRDRDVRDLARDGLGAHAA